MNNRRLFTQIVILLIYTSVAVACMSQLEVLTTDEATQTPVVQRHPNLPFDSAGQVEEIVNPTSLPETAIHTRTPAFLPTPFPTIPACLGDSLFYLDYHGYDKEWRFLGDLFWLCPDNSSTQLIVSNIGARYMAVSPDGDRVALAGDTIQIANLSTGELTNHLEGVPEEYIRFLTWAPDGEYLLFQRFSPETYYSLRTIHISSGTVSEAFIPVEYQDQLIEASIASAIWLPDREQVLLLGDVALALFLMDVTCDDASHLCTANNLRQIPINRHVKNPVAISPDGTKIATRCTISGTHPVEITLCILDFNGNIIQEFMLEGLGIDYIYSLAWSPDSTRIALDNGIGILLFSLIDQSLTNLDIAGKQPVWLP